MAVNDGNNIILGVLTESGADVKNLKQDIADSVKNLNEFNKTWDLTRSKVRELNVEMQKFIKDFGELGSLKSIQTLLSNGGVNTSLRNAQVQGGISKAQATDVAASARELNGIFQTLFNTIKAQANRTILELSTERQSAAAGTDIQTLKSQIAASQLRSGIFSQQQSLADSRGQAKEAERLALLVKQEEEDQQLLNAALQQTIALEKQRIKSKTDLLALDQKMALLEAEISAVQGGGGTRAEVAKLEIEKQELIVRKALLESEGVVTAEVKQQLLLKQQLITATKAAAQAEKEAVAQAKKTQQSNTVGNTGRSPADLFKIQADLLVNYFLMNQIFKLIGFGTQFVVELDKAFRDLQATVAITDTEMVQLKQVLIDASTGTRFSAVEVAKAAVTMGQAGLSVKQIQDSIKPIILFATATGSDLALAVDTATSVMTIFNVQASEMGHVANVLTGAINESKLSVEKLATGIQYAGTVAADSGAQFEEFVAVLGAASNAGIKSGSTIGTGLRQILTAFLEPTAKMVKVLNDLHISVEQIDVRSQGLIGVFRNLKDAGFTTSDAFKALDIRAASMFASISSNLTLAERLQREFLLTDAATKANDTQMKSLSSTFDRFSNLLGITINTGLKPLSEILQTTLKWIGDFLITLNKMPATLTFITASLATLLTTLASIKLGSLIFDLFKLKEVFAAIEAEGFIAALGAGLAAVISPLGLFVAALAVAGGAYAVFNSGSEIAASNIDQLKASVNESKGALETTNSKIQSVQDSLQKLSDRYPELIKNQEALKTEALALQIKFGKDGLKGVFDDSVLTVEKLTNALRDMGTELNKLAATQAGDVVAKQALLLQQTALNLRNASPLPTTTAGGRLSQGLGILSSGVTGIPSGYNTDQYLASNQTASLASRYTQQKLDPFLQQLGAVDYTKLTSVGNDNIQKQVEKAREAIDIMLNNVTTELQAVTLAKGQGIKTRDGQIVSVEEEMKTLSQLQAAIADREAKLNELQAQLLAQQTNVDVKVLKSAQADTAISILQQLVADEGQKLNALESELLSGKGADGKDLTSDQKTQLREQINKAKQWLAERTVENMLQALLLEFPNLLTDGKLDEGGIKAAIKGVQEQAQAALAEEKDKEAKAYTQKKSAYEELYKQEQAHIDALEKMVAHATDALDEKKKNLDFIVRETADRQRGGLRGVYSDVEVEMFKDQQKLLDVQILQTRQQALQKEIAGFNGSIGRLGGSLSDISNATGRSDETDFAGKSKQLVDILAKRDEIQKKLIETTAELAAVTGNAGEASVSFGDQLQYVLKKQRELNLLNSDFRLNLGKIVNQISNDASAAFGKFFTDIASGTKKISAAFKDMAASIIQSLLKIVTDRLAAQAWGMLFGLIGGGLGGGGGGSSFFPGSNTWVDWNAAAGGQAPIHAATGMHTRDSVKALLRPGEFVMRNSAVDALGADNLSQLNAYGNRKVQSSAPGSMPPPPPQKVETNVWLVQQGQQPSLGPNDVVATIGGDILRGGEIKKLIKQVMAGA